MASRTWHHLAFSLGLVLALSLGGCIMAGFAASIYGDLPVKALYVPAKRPLLVLVKDSPDPAGLMIESDTIAMQLEEELTQYQIAPLVSSKRIDEVRMNNLAHFGSMSPAQIGQALGADQVLLVQIQSSSLDSGAARDMIKGQIATSVSIIDTATRKPLWPTDGSVGVLVAYSTPMRRIDKEVTPLTMSRNLYAGVTTKIVRLFRTYKADME